MTDINSKRGATLAAKTPPDSSEYEEIEIEEAGTVERLALRIYPGAEATLELVPLLVSGGSTVPLIDLVGQSFVDGDDDHWEWDLVQPVEQGDRVRVRARNRDPDHPHRWRAVVEVDHHSGSSRFIDSLTGVF